MNIYECPIHDQDFETGARTGCEVCTRIQHLIKHNEDVSKRIGRRIKLKPQVYWPKSGDKDCIDGGRVIENLTPEPVFVRNKNEFRDLLKRTNSLEK